MANGTSAEGCSQGPGGQRGGGAPAPEQVPDSAGSGANGGMGGAWPRAGPNRGVAVAVGMARSEKVDLVQAGPFPERHCSVGVAWPRGAWFVVGRIGRLEWAWSSGGRSLQNPSLDRAGRGWAGSGGAAGRETLDSAAVCVYRGLCTESFVLRALCRDHARGLGPEVPHRLVSACFSQGCA